MGGVQPTGKGKGRSMDAQVNLVPYIDLLMTIMTFLIMTAVWTRIASLEVQANTGSEAEPKDEKEEPPPPVNIILSEQGLQISQQGTENKDFPYLAGRIDRKSLHEALKIIKDGSKDITRQVVKVKPEDTVTYDRIVEVIDVARDPAIGLVGISVEPAAR